MKKYLFVFLILLTVGTKAQTNTFPTDGNVGIGTTAPNYKLEVNGHVSAGGNSGNGASNLHTSRGRLAFSNTATDANHTIYNNYVNIDGEGIWDGMKMNVYNGLWIRTGNANGAVPATALYINNFGNVGIGTTSPTSPWNKVLQVYDSYNVAMSLKTPNHDWQISTAADGKLNIYDNTTGVHRLNIDVNGNVGIGTTAPGTKLDVNGSVWAGNGQVKLESSSSGYAAFYNGSTVRLGYIGNSTTNLAFNAENSANFTFIGGNVGIGTTSPSEKLSVNGNIRSRKLIVTQTGWADYVFNKTYRLKPLEQVENYIKTNKHLPEVPSAKQVEKDGIDVGNTQTILLKKIEELTLYMIEQNKRIEKLETENTRIKKQLNEIK